MAEGEYQSSQGGVDMTSRDAPPGGGGGCGCDSDAQGIQYPTAVDGMRQRNAAAGRSRAWPNTEPSGQDISGYAHEDRTMP